MAAPMPQLLVSHGFCGSSGAAFPDLTALLAEWKHSTIPPLPVTGLLAHLNWLFNPFPCGMCRGLYRASLSQWLHPDAVVPPGSHLHNATNAMHTPLKPVHNGYDGKQRGSTKSLSQSFRFTKAMQPCFLAALVYVDAPGKPVLIKPTHGDHVSIPIGVSWGNPDPLGCSCVHPTSAAPERSPEATTGPLSVNFSVVSRHASASLPFVICVKLSSFGIPGDCDCLYWHAGWPAPPHLHPPSGCQLARTPWILWIRDERIPSCCPDVAIHVRWQDIGHAVFAGSCTCTWSTCQISQTGMHKAPSRILTSTNDTLQISSPSLSMNVHFRSMFECNERWLGWSVLA